MDLTRIESTLIPNTMEGQAFAKEYQERLRQQGSFRRWAEDNTSIIITAVYHFHVTDDSGEDEE